jgi:hypothetical protein
MLWGGAFQIVTPKNFPGENGYFLYVEQLTSPYKCTLCTQENGKGPMDNISENDFCSSKISAKTVQNIDQFFFDVYQIYEPRDSRFETRGLKPPA